MMECITFMKFLNEEYATDELKFYLHSRNILFEGPQLDHNKSTFEVFHKLSYEWVVTITKQLMYKLEENQIEDILKLLKSRVDINHNLELIDSGFVLRVYLEYYRNEKIKNLK